MRRLLYRPVSPPAVRYAADRANQCSAVHAVILITSRAHQLLALGEEARRKSGPANDGDEVVEGPLLDEVLAALDS